MAGLKAKMLSWAKQFNIFCLLDNQQYAIAPHRYECLLAADARASCASGNLADLDAFIQKGSWTFGHLSYELKSAIHEMPGVQEDKTGFPLFYFFRPRYLLLLKDGVLHIHGPSAEKVLEALLAIENEEGKVNRVEVVPGLTKDAYIRKIKKLQEHIRRGDCYEINFCQEFYAETAVVDPVHLYEVLVKESPNPFSALYRYEDSYLLCASPERFLFREGDCLLSQPIKGTIRRNLDDSSEDAALKEALRQSAKDRAENVMIVDLVRNDLSVICKDSSVQVEELFGIYPFPQVHHMISTISGTIDPDITFSEIISATFPMGSMTGAPKRRVMELIDAYEESPRGIFSGSVGYIDPSGGFDFNVVIRSIMYNAGSGYLSYKVGSGITVYSDPEAEWEECLLKAAAIKKVLAS